MKKIAIGSIAFLLGSVNAFATTLNCKSELNQYELQLRTNLEDSIVLLNGQEQLTSNVLVDGDQVHITVIDLELAAASTLSLSKSELEGDATDILLSAELLGAPGSQANYEKVLCKKVQ